MIKGADKEVRRTGEEKEPNLLFMAHYDCLVHMKQTIPPLRQVRGVNDNLGAQRTVLLALHIFTASRSAHSSHHLSRRDCAVARLAFLLSLQSSHGRDLGRRQEAVGLGRLHDLLHLSRRRGRLPPPFAGRSQIREAGAWKTRDCTGRVPCCMSDAWRLGLFRWVDRVIVHFGSGSWEVFAVPTCPHSMMPVVTRPTPSCPPAPAMLPRKVDIRMADTVVAC